MVHALHNEVRRLGKEQSNNVQEVQRLRPEQLSTAPPVELSEGADDTSDNSCRTRNHRHENLEAACASGDESTWDDLSFKLRSCVSVLDLQLGRMLEAAELAAHASTGIPSEPLNQDMDAQLIRQQPSGVRASRYLDRRCNPRAHACSMAQLPEIIASYLSHRGSQQPMMRTCGVVFKSCQASRDDESSAVVEFAFFALGGLGLRSAVRGRPKNPRKTSSDVDIMEFPCFATDFQRSVVCRLQRSADTGFWTWVSVPRNGETQAEGNGLEELQRTGTPQKHRWRAQPPGSVGQVGESARSRSGSPSTRQVRQQED